MQDSVVLVEVLADVDDQRQINWGANVAERLEGRIDDIRRAVMNGTAAIAESLPAVPVAEGWRLSEVSASFGVSLTAEAGVIISKAEAGATFEVSVAFKRADSD